MISLIIEHYISVVSVIIAIFGLIISNRRNRFLMEKSRRETDRAITSLQEQVNHLSSSFGRLHNGCEKLESQVFDNIRDSTEARAEIKTAIYWLKVLISVIKKQKGDSNG